MFKNLLRTSCHWKRHLSNFNLKIQASWDAMLCCGVKNCQHSKAVWSSGTSEPALLTILPHPRRLWPSAVQLWEPEILHNLSSVVPTCWVYKCKLWSRGDTSMIWCSILYINFVGNVWTLPTVQFALCSLDQLQIFKPLALSIRYGPTVTQCDAQNAIRQILITANNCLLYPAVIWYPVS